MPLHPFFPQLVEVGTPAIRALEHQLHTESIEELSSPRGLGRGIDLPLHEVDRAPEHELLEEAWNVEDEPPERSPKVPEELVNEQVPGTADVPEPRGSLNGLRLSLAHVATS